MNVTKLNGLNAPERFAAIARLHTGAFAWQPQDRIPLGIHVVNPNHMGEFDYREWLNPRVVFDFQVKVLMDTLTVGSDLLPAVAINHLGESIVPSMFGAKLHLPATAGVTLQNFGPTPLPIFSSIEEATNIRTPDMNSGIVPDVVKMLQYYRAHLPPWVPVVPPMPSGPFSLAMSLRGSDFLLDVIDQPNLAFRLVSQCAKLQAGVDRYLRRMAGIPDKPLITNFGIMAAGLRLGEDSIVNLSPALIRQYCLPAVDIVNGICGGRGHLHFCSLPQSRFEHIYRVLAESDEAQVVSSQFGFEYYARHLDEIRNRLAVEAMYAPAYKYICSQHGSFENWAAEFVPKYKNESGLVLYLQVDSLEEGHQVWKCWQKAHNRRGK